MICNRTNRKSGHPMDMAGRKSPGMGLNVAVIDWAAGSGYYQSIVRHNESLYIPTVDTSTPPICPPCRPIIGQAGNEGGRIDDTA